MKQNVIAILIICISFLTRCDSTSYQPHLEPKNTPTRALLQAISIVDQNTAWFSGHQGTFIRTENQGEEWKMFRHPTGDTLQFRDIHAFSKDKVVLMSAGTGPLSRIFTFTVPDRWEENFVMEDSIGFLDCIAFWDDQRGIAYGDAIDNYPYILITRDGGKSWSRADTTHMPRAGKGEGGFAASGSCVTTDKNGKAWIATGAGGHCRFLITEDYGQSWNAVPSPLTTGDAAGNTSVSFVDDIGIVAGGDLLKPDEYTDNCAFSKDGGYSWALAQRPETRGAFYGSAITRVGDQHFAFVCGPNGLDYTADLGQSWINLDTLNYWAVSMSGKIGYACGKDGKILKISLRP